MPDQSGLSFEKPSSNSPTLPNTGPDLARSVVNHMAKPSPNNECAFPFTWKDQAKLSGRDHDRIPRCRTHVEFDLDLVILRLDGQPGP